MKLHTSAWLAVAIFATLLFTQCKGREEQPTPAGPTDAVAGLAELSALIAANPNDPALYAKRAELYYDNNSYDEAIRDMGQALTLDSTNIPYHHLLADIYLDYFRSRLALQTMERAARIAPDDVFTLLKLAEIHLFLKQHDNSMKNIDQALRREPRNALAFFLMGKNFEETGDTIRAINSFQEVTEIDASNVDAWVKLGQLHASIKGSLAERFFDAAIEVDSNSVLALNAKAEYLWDQDRPEDALQLYRKAVIRNPMDEKSAYNAGLVYLELDSLQQAYDHFSVAIQNKPLYVAAYYYRGYAAERLGNLAQAKQDYQRVTSMAPDFAEAQEALNRLEGAKGQ